MYHLLGMDENVRNIYKAVFPHIGQGREINTIDDLRLPYLEFLRKQQPQCPTNFDDNPFITDIDIESQLASSYSEGSLDDLQQSNLIGESYDNRNKKSRISFSAIALNQLMEKDSNLAALFKLVIHSIFTKKYSSENGTRGTHGGSSSGAIGAIWITVNEGINEIDLMELFLHELTHHLIFIDELNYPQFNYKEIKKKENYAYSAILNLSRPLDKVVHSIVVATEIVLAREHILSSSQERKIHPSTEKMKEDIYKSIESIEALKNIESILKPRAFDLLDHCLQSLDGVQS
ncbi:hypothetical protein AS19_27790 [Alcanivorax sp. NBRC 101098]|uniref:aKG-HExxH-type peptide beta-hydroxylase n=1 Tax=Alcanivorax sp. NBRC 101098 TaxID=1113728 RepID=UPI0004ABE265|nr:HEXXH motif-containing putative peptide modification protein [Alcanivorax sp. NBRC 101098]BAP15630.1 hypothetical protein AS19_27790 [Alcanivorax sp. NBRC 101098]